MFSFRFRLVRGFPGHTANMCMPGMPGNGPGEKKRKIACKCPESLGKKLLHKPVWRAARPIFDIDVGTCRSLLPRIWHESCYNAHAHGKPGHHVGKGAIRPRKHEKAPIWARNCRTTPSIRKSFSRILGFFVMIQGTCKPTGWRNK